MHFGPILVPELSIFLSMQPGLIGELDIHGWEAKYAQDVDGLSRSSLAQVWQHGTKKEMCVVNHELTFYSNSCNS